MNPCLSMVSAFRRRSKCWTPPWQRQAQDTMASLLEEPFRFRWHRTGYRPRATNVAVQSQCLRSLPKSSRRRQICDLLGIPSSSAVGFVTGSTAAHVASLLAARRNRYASDRASTETSTGIGHDEWGKNEKNGMLVPVGCLKYWRSRHDSNMRPTV